MDLVKDGSIFTLLVKQLPQQIKLYLTNILKENNNWQSVTNIIKAICLDKSLKNCQTCGKQLRYSQNRFCCPRCAQNSKQTRNKAKQTNIQKFGI